MNRCVKDETLMKFKRLCATTTDNIVGHRTFEGGSTGKKLMK